MCENSKYLSGCTAGCFERAYICLNIYVIFFYFLFLEKSQITFIYFSYVYKSETQSIL